jgi:hypothetical protein
MVGFGLTRDRESAPRFNAPTSMIEILSVFARWSGEYPGGINRAGVIVDGFLGEAIDCRKKQEGS